MSLPKEPRQKMINVMYLVLTALLALNVSAEILNAFKTVNNSLLTSNGITDKKNQTLFTSFEEMLKDPRTKDSAAVWAPKALKAKELAEGLSTYLDGIKAELIKKSKPKVVDGKNVYSYDNLDAATKYFVEGPEAKKRGEELLQKLTEYKEQLLAIDPVIRAEVEANLPLDLTIPETSSKVKGDWAYSYFHMTPTVAAVTILSKFQNDVKNSEAEVVEACHKKIGAVKIVFDKFQAIASQSSEYLMPDQELTITGGVGAFSSAAKPIVSIDGSSIALNADGVAEYKTKVGGPGSYSKNVTINFLKPNGEKGTLTKEIKYTVGSPTGASVSADATKVFYVGLKNPITVSGGTAGAEKTHVSISNGSIAPGDGAGKYDVTVTSGTEAIVTVNVDGGASTPFKFRVKQIPDPVAMIGSSKGGKMAANEFKAQLGVRAELENFIFEGVKYKVVNYQVIATGKGFSENPGIAQNNGAEFGSEARGVIDRCVKGTAVFIDNIKAVGPDGRTRSLPTIAFNLN
ncbi:gliding motility protein GldM [Parasediminibacterium sp. JCM 36343]|uniref:type IX secretion system motor protein PorM/GldM n=1 Tax=Parasediminibacterium sp. JCM 36343 TaxID=3374279 RepID=UPI00397D095D